MKEIIIKVNGMSCTGCEKRIENALSMISAIKEIKANHKEGTVVIKTDSDVDLKIVKEKIEDIGFETEE